MAIEYKFQIMVTFTNWALTKKTFIWHVEFQHIFQLLNNLISIIVNRLNDMNNCVSKNMSLVPLDQLGPHTSILHATVDHQGHFMCCGYCTTSGNCYRKTFYNNDDRITECNTSDTRNSITHLHIYGLTQDCSNSIANALE